jgi:hypothetical protein
MADVGPSQRREARVLAQGQKTKSIRQQQELVMGRILNSTVTGMSHRKNKNGKNAELLRFFPTVARPS